MRRSILLMMLPIGVVSADAFSIDPSYFLPLKDYNGQLGRDPLDVQNSEFVSVLTSNQAKRDVRRALKQSKDDNQVIVEPERDSDHESRAHNSGGNVNIASPKIIGNVRGRVTVIVQRGAIKGDINNVRR